MAVGVGVQMAVWMGNVHKRRLLAGGGTLFVLPVLLLAARRGDEGGLIKALIFRSGLVWRLLCSVR